MDNEINKRYTDIPGENSEGSAGRMERVLSREAMMEERYGPIEKLRIGIVGISANAGASFLAGCMARYLANTGKHSPAVVELGSGSFYDAYGMDKRFAGRAFFHFYKALEENKSIRGVRNMDEGINWIVRSPGEWSIRLSFEQKLRLVNHAKGDVIFCDLSGEGDLSSELLLSMDQIVAVVDPLPSGMLEGYGRLCSLKALETGGREIVYVINKFNRGVNKRQMLDFLNVKKPVMIPLINPESIYTAEYNCKIPYALSEAREILRKPLSEIVCQLNF